MHSGLAQPRRVLGGGGGRRAEINQRDCAPGYEQRELAQPRGIQARMLAYDGEDALQCLKQRLLAAAVAAHQQDLMRALPLVPAVRHERTRSGRRWYGRWRGGWRWRRTPQQRRVRASSIRCASEHRLVTRRRASVRDASVRDAPAREAPARAWLQGRTPSACIVLERCIDMQGSLTLSQNALRERPHALATGALQLDDIVLEKPTRGEIGLGREAIGDGRARVCVCVGGGGGGGGGAL